MISSPLTALLLALPQQPTNPPTPIPAPLLESQTESTTGKAPTAHPRPTNTTTASILQVTTHARLFPHDTMAVVSVAPLARHQRALSKTGFARLFKSSLELLGRDGQLASLGLRGMPEWDLRDVLGNGVSFGITEMSGQDSGHWMLIANLEEHAESFQETLFVHHKSVLAHFGKVQETLHGTTKIYTVSHREGRTYSWAIHESKLVVADTLVGVTEALDRHAAKPSATRSGSKSEGEPKPDAASKPPAEPAPANLAGSPAYRRFAIRCSGEGAPFFTIFVQPQVAIQALLSRLPAAFQARAERLTQQLELLETTELGFAMFAHAGQVKDLVWIGYPKPLSGLLQALARGDKGVSRDQYKGIASDVSAVSLTSVHWLDIYHSAIAMVRSFDPSIPQNLKKTLEDLYASTGVRVEDEILANLGEQFMFEEWYSPSGILDSWGATIQLKHPKTFTTAMQKLASEFGLPATTINGKPAVLLLPSTGTMERGANKTSTGTLLLGHGNVLVAANSPVLARRVMAGLDDGTGHSRVKAALESLETRPVSFGWADCARYGKQVVSSLSVQWGHPDVRTWLNQMLEKGGGEIVSTIEMTEQGIAFRSRSPYGNLYLSLTAAYFLRSHFEGQLGDGELISESDRIRGRQTGLLQKIVTAQSRFREARHNDADTDGQGEFGTMNQLLDHGLLEGTRLEATGSAGTFRKGPYLFRVYLPADTDDREQQLVAFAWPADRKTGVVFAVTAGGLVQENSILAHIEGLATCEPRDFYQRGVFGSVMVSGWRELEPTAGRSALLTDPAPMPTGELTSEERKVFDQIEKAEAADEVILLLESNNPRIAARAAYAMGSLQCREAVLILCQMVHEHQNVQVQRQAMAALIKIRDPRSKRSTVQALSSSDVKVRALAVQNLASMGAVDTRDKLLAVLSIADAVPDSPDRIATFVALADIGNPKALVPAAASARPGKMEQQALVYLFQTVSPRLTPDLEVETLIAVLANDSELLRRYAIQRLGVLKHPAAAKALEGRLAKETVLQELVLASLNAVRGSGANDSTEELIATAKNQANHLWSVTGNWWKSLGDLRRYLVIGVAVACGVLVLMWRRIRRRRRLQADSDAMVAMVGHSEGFEDEDYDEDYGEDGEYAEDEDVEAYFDPEYQNPGSFQPLASSEVELDEAEDMIELESDGEYDDWDETEDEYDEVESNQGDYPGAR